MTNDTSGPSYGTVDRTYGMRLAMTPPDEDGPVWMVNLMSYHEVARYEDGREESISGREADGPPSVGLADSANLQARQTARLGRAWHSAHRWWAMQFPAQTAG